MMSLWNTAVAGHELSRSLTRCNPELTKVPETCDDGSMFSLRYRTCNLDLWGLLFIIALIGTKPNLPKWIFCRSPSPRSKHLQRWDRAFLIWLRKCYRREIAELGCLPTHSSWCRQSTYCTRQRRSVPIRQIYPEPRTHRVYGLSNVIFPQIEIHSPKTCISPLVKSTSFVSRLTVDMCNSMTQSSSRRVDARLPTAKIVLDGHTNE